VFDKKSNPLRPEAVASGKPPDLQSCFRAAGLPHTVTVSPALATRCGWVDPSPPGVDRYEVAWLVRLALNGHWPHRQRQTEHGQVLLLDFPTRVSGQACVNLQLGIVVSKDQKLHLVDPDELDQTAPKRAFVLAAEDDPEIARLVCALLEHDGFTVTHAPNGLEAWKLVQSGQIKTLQAKLTATREALAVENFDDINFQPELKTLEQLHHEQDRLKKSSNKIQELEKQLAETQDRIDKRGKKLEKMGEDIGGLKKQLAENMSRVNKLKAVLHGVTLDMAAIQGQVGKFQEADNLTIENVEDVEDAVDKKIQRKIYEQGTIINNLQTAVAVAMKDFLMTYPDETADLKADITYGEEFCKLQERVEGEQLPVYKERFFSLLNTNLIMDIAALNTKLSEQEVDIRKRIESVNLSLRKIKFSPETYVQITMSPTKTDEFNRFKTDLKKCLSHGILPAPEDQERIYTNIRELISRFDKEPEWTNRVTDVRNWLEYGVRELYAADNTEAEYYSASSGKSGGQKSLLAFTILASAITAQYGLNGDKDDIHRFRLVVVDEAFGKTDEENSQRALELFKELGLQLVVINPFDAKSRIVEDYVDSYHLVTKQDEVSSLRRASRAEYESVREVN
jgi:uncharacterized protein YPO0396